MGKESGETDYDGFFVDQLPSFDIILTAANEHGAVANSVIKGVTISNFGTTMSVDDMYMESTYTYVAENFWPFVKDSATVMRMISEYDKSQKASQLVSQLQNRLSGSGNSQLSEAQKLSLLMAEALRIANSVS